MPEVGPVQGTDGKFYTLYYSTCNGDANLTVGFFLQGPNDIIKYLKKWDFGDGTPAQKDHSFVVNHFYSGTPSPCNGSVTVFDLDVTKPPIITISFQISINTHQGQYISNFYQTEGVTVDGSKIGFAIDESLVMLPTLIWDYDGKGGSGEPVDIGKSQNPNHKYQNPKYDMPYQGVVKLLGQENPPDPNKPLDKWNFSVMILPSLIKYVGWMDFFSDSNNKTAKVKIGSKVVFTAQVSGGIPFDNPNYVWDVQAKSLDVITPPQISSNGPTLQCTFTKSSTYQVRCMIFQKSPTSPEPFLVILTYVFAGDKI